MKINREIDTKSKFKYWKIELHWNLDFKWIQDLNFLKIGIYISGFNRKPGNFGIRKKYKKFIYYSESKKDIINNGEELLLFEFYKYIKSIDCNKEKEYDCKATTIAYHKIIKSENTYFKNNIKQITARYIKKEKNINNLLKDNEFKKFNREDKLKKILKGDK